MPLFHLDVPLHRGISKACVRECLAPTIDPDDQQLRLRYLAPVIALCSWPDVEHLDPCLSAPSQQVGDAHLVDAHRLGSRHVVMLLGHALAPSSLAVRREAYAFVP